MHKFKVGDRVKPTADFLSEGTVIKLIWDITETWVIFYKVKLDKKAPNTYAWDTDEVSLSEDELEEVICSNG